MCRRPLLGVLLAAVAALLLSGAGMGQEGVAVSRESVGVTHYEDAVVVYLEDLDMLRQQSTALTGEFRLIPAQGEPEAPRHVDLSAGYQHPAIILGKAQGAECRAVSVTIKDGGKVIFSEEMELGPVVKAEPVIALSDQTAAIELGSGMGEAPVIRLPDLSRLKEETTRAPERHIDLASITKQVRCDVNYPLVSASNNAAISRQSADPEDDEPRGIYVPMKSQLFDQKTGEPTKVAHYLVEVPLQAEWLAGQEDLVVNLQPDETRLHTSEETFPPDQETGAWILGEAARGLGQLVGTVAVDDDGSIYYSAVPPGVVRFNVHRGEFELPPVDVDAHFAKLLPTLDEIPDELKRENNSVRWEGYKIIAINRGRLFYAPIINALYQRDDNASFVFASVLSMPTEHWDDAEKFEAGLRFNVGSWPGCEHSFWDSFPDPADRTRKLGRLWPRGDSIYITAYNRDWGGPWRLDVAGDGGTLAFERVASVPPGPTGAKPTNAPGLAEFNNYGTVTLTRSNLRRILTGETGADLPGSIQINYDVISKMRAEPERYGWLLESLSGPSLAPAYMAVALPDRRGQVAGVAEYGYYMATFYVSTAAEGYVKKTFLNRDVGDSELDLPLAVGLGPYGHTWAREGDDLYLYMGGYTGLTRLLYSSAGKSPARFSTARLDRGMQVNVLDQAGEGHIKRYRYLLPGLDDRIFLTGTHTAARGGTAYSGGLISFKTTSPDTLDKLSYMSRCYWTTNLRSRIVYPADGPPTQEFFLGGGGFDKGYVFTLEQGLVPDNKDPKIFLYEYAQGGVPKDLYGFSLAREGEEAVFTDHAFSRDRRYLVILQGTSLVTLEVATGRFIDGRRLALPGAPIYIPYFFRPTYRLIRTPDDRLIFYATKEEGATQGTFMEIEVSADGRLSLRPYLTLTADDPAMLQRAIKAVIAFVPDLAKRDGSYDLFMGVPWRAPGTDVRIIEDFIPPRL